MVLTNPCIILVSLFVQYKFIRQFKVAMADSSKRSLREKRPPKNFDSDNQDKDPWGYSRPGYSKEQKNPLQQANYDAKLLVKYISTINKRYREYQEENHYHQTQVVREPPPRDRKTKTVYQPQKPSNETGRQAKPQPLRKQKESENIQAQINAKEAQNRPKTDSFLNKFKALNTQSANKMLNIQSSLSKNKQNSIDATRIKQEKFQAAIQQSQLRNKLKKNQTQANFKSQLKNGSQNHPSNNQRPKEMQSINTSQSKFKVFKRSAFHIAIAYQIHICKVRQKGGSENELDPTYAAKKLRQRIN